MSKEGRSNKRGIIVGALLIILGLVIMSGATSLATVTWPGIDKVTPSGTIEEPTLVVPGNEVSLMLEMTVANTYGMNLKGYQSWNVTAKLTCDRSSVEPQSVRLAYRIVQVLPIEGSAKRQVACYEAKWMVPYEAGGANYRIDWTVRNGEDLLASKVSYASAQANEPDGEWYIEGKLAQDDSYINLTDARVHVEFRPTMWAANVDSVRVELWHEGRAMAYADLEKDGDVWKAVIDLPEEGSYGLKGTMTSKTGNSYTMLQAVMQYGDGGNDNVDPYHAQVPDTDILMIGALLMFLGAVVLVFAIRGRR